ncbi:unnamed protein product [Zymoseptoria tritici ST99CH_3D1]|nr:unnamed protein product [Zymoseptoria tritici ST99CH_3D1]
MDLGPDIYEDAQAESSSAALARRQPQTRPDRSQTVTTAASFTTAPETPPIPHTADSSNDVTHANPVYKSNPTTNMRIARILLFVAVHSAGGGDVDGSTGGAVSFSRHDAERGCQREGR